jgi:septum formation protein
MNIVLASQSKYRRGLLKQIALPFTAVNPEVDESQFKNGQLSPDKVASRLAALKGEAVSKRFKDAVIIASDQVAHLNNDILSKPKNRQTNIDQLMRLSGQTHELATALWMRHPDQGVQEHLLIAKIKMRSLSRKQIEEYVDYEQAFDCAGGYKLESAGARLIEHIDCPDHSAIIGLPLIQVVSTLNAWNVILPYQKESS